MARKPGKKHQAALEQVEARDYLLAQAVPLLQKIKFAKYDETVEIHMRLGADQKHASRMVRGTVLMPDGFGKSRTVLVIASGDKLREATEAGADFVGGEEMVDKIQSESWMAFDIVIATPDMMRSVGKLDKVLGPRGLMPSPETGTVTTDVAKAVRDVKAGKVEFRADETGVIHAPIGKLSFPPVVLVENAASLIGAVLGEVLRAKPSEAKVKYVKSATLWSGMGSGISLDVAALIAQELTIPGNAGLVPAPLVPQSDYAAVSKRYQTLLQKRRIGQANSEDSKELEGLVRALESQPAPPGFHDAMISLANDRQALRESMERIEQLLSRQAQPKRRANKANAKSSKIQKLPEVQTLPSY